MVFKNQNLAYRQLPMMPQIPELHGAVHESTGIEGASFGHTLSQLISKSSDLIGKPDSMAINAVKSGNVDIHEIMIAMGKADVSFKLITAVTQKVVSAFDKLTSMQV